MKRVLLIGDLVGYEKIAVSAMIPILSCMNCNVNTMLTSIISNNFAYGNSVVKDLTDYMRECLDLWKEFGIKFDIIFVGYLTSMDQVRIIEELIDFNDNPLVVADPIMGDDGKLYNTVDDKVKLYTKEMIDHADIIIPNLTEAAILLDEDPKQEMTSEKIEHWLNRLAKGGKSAIITSVYLDEGNFVYGLDNYSKDNEVFRIEYQQVEKNFTGTGDIFTSLVLGKLSNGLSLQEAASYASQKIYQIIKSEYEIKKDLNKLDSVQIENYLKDL